MKKFTIQDEFLNRCFNLKSLLDKYTASIKTGDWPEEGGEQVDPQILISVYHESIALGLDIPDLFKTFIKTLDERIDTTYSD